MRKNLCSTPIPALIATAYFDIAKYLNLLACSSAKRSHPLICSLQDLDRAPVICSLDADQSLTIHLPTQLVEYLSSHIIKPMSFLTIDLRFKCLLLIVTRSDGYVKCGYLTHPLVNPGEKLRADVSPEHASANLWKHIFPSLFLNRTISIFVFFPTIDFHFRLPSLI